jgi:drug/metabolite transporter (DMT)-like permease
MKLNRTEVLGLFYAFIGVFLFSLSLPMTKWALESFNPFFTATARPIIAAVLAIPLMITLKIPAFPRDHLRALLFTTLGGVFGWPILIAFALQRTTSAHIAVIAAIMPLTTAIIAVLRTGTHVSVQFWIASSLGTLLLILFALTRGGGSDGDLLADLLTFLAVLASSYCYVEGAELTKFMPGWQVISWVVVTALPICIPASILIWVQTHKTLPVTTHAVIGLAAIGISSMYLGFFAWYRGLKDAGTAHGSQVQQLQAIMTLGWSALLLGERVTISMVLIALGVITSVLWALTSRQRILN